MIRGRSIIKGNLWITPVKVSEVYTNIGQVCLDENHVYVIIH